MSRGARIGLLVAAVAILVVAFIALRPSAEDEGTTAETPTETPSVATTAPAETPTAGASRDADAFADAAPDGRSRARS